MSSLITRRHAIALGSGAIGALAAPHILSAAITTNLEIWGPPVGPSAVLAHAVKIGALTNVAPDAEVRVKVWRNPDELRAGLTSKNIALSVVPVQAAVNLYNKGFPIQLVNIMTKGLLYVISTNPEINSLQALKGQSLVVPFKGDTPDIILDRLLENEGILQSTDVKNVGTPIEAVQMLVSGRIEAALLPEPAISAAIMAGKQKGLSITRVIDIQEEWGKLNGSDPIIPQAGLAVTGSFVETHGDIIPALHDGLVQAADATLADPMAAAQAAAPAMKLPVPVIADSIKHSHLGAWKASELRGPVETMLTAMGEVDIKKIAGKLPDDGFYYF
ncbi:ABC transporter substrate-binding protein [Shimia sagamensis]|uniref:NitT/TauT family transport system substrate-binding protein n=1 Tax=Shimia sagamensis TaxID=1566352 RepID=A0ABY1PEN7_9RHOB|nr:ABC transporter substrate-binding protein [Shimia sagamensis]SMP31050.1 NitT/TauT family transport system substrate-binding protein [Shimia sagamensis]